MHAIIVLAGRRLRRCSAHRGHGPRRFARSPSTAGILCSGEERTSATVRRHRGVSCTRQSNCSRRSEQRGRCGYEGYGRPAIALLASGPPRSPSPSPHPAARQARPRTAVRRAARPTARAPTPVFSKRGGARASTQGARAGVIPLTNNVHHIGTVRTARRRCRCRRVRGDRERYRRLVLRVPVARIRVV